MEPIDETEWPMTMQVAILAAGMGTRLGRPWPKPLTRLDDGRSIMGQQRDNIASVFGAQARVMTVVGFKLESILEAFPDGLFVYNENFDTTNTSKSLLKALRFSSDGPVLWMNGDVVFDPAVLARLESNILRGDNVICVNTSVVGEEEVKYTVDEDGHVDELSKKVENALGEAVGINLISGKDKAETHRVPRGVRRAGLLRAWHRIGDRAPRCEVHSGRHLRPLRGRDRLRR